MKCLFKKIIGYGVLFICLCIGHQAWAAIDLLVHENESKSVSFSGLDEPFKIKISNPAAVQAQMDYDLLIITGLSQGTAIVEVIDAKGNKITVNVTVDAPAYRLMTYVSQADQGMVIIAPDQDTYKYGDQVMLTALPKSDCYEFVEWENDCSFSLNNTCLLTMDGNKSVKAIFDANQFDVDIQAQDGKVLQAPDSATYACGSTVLLNPVPDDGFMFSHWEGDLTGTEAPAYVTVNKNMTINAIFVPEIYTVIISISPVGSGSVVIDPMRFEFMVNELVELSANPAPGFRFDHWEDGISGSEPNQQIQMTHSISVVAVFTEVPDFHIAPEVSDAVRDSIITLTAAGGTEPYIWSANVGDISTSTGAEVTYHVPDAPGEYQVTVMDDSSLTAIGKVRVYDRLRISPTIHLLEIGQEMNFFMYGGKMPYSVQTESESTDMSTVNGDIFVFTAPNTEGQSILHFFDALGQEQTMAIRILPQKSMRITPINTIIGVLGQVPLRVLGGIPPYRWSASGGQLSSVQDPSVMYFAPSNPGTYDILVADSKNLEATSVVEVISDLMIYPLNASVLMENNQAITFRVSGGIAPYQWAADFGKIDGEGLEIKYYPPVEGGDYQVKVVDGQQQEVYASIHVTSVPKISPSHVMLHSTETETFTVTGGTPPYEWAADFGNLSSYDGESVTYSAGDIQGSDRVYIVDAQGNQTKAIVQMINEPIIQPYKTSVAPGDIVHFSVSRGTEPYLWPDGSNGKTWDTVYEKEGSYEVIVTDANTYPALASIEVVEPSIAIIPAFVDVTPGESIHFNVVGGDDPYKWDISVGTLSNSSGEQVTYIAPDRPGIYYLIVKDADSLQGTAQVFVSMPVMNLQGESRNDMGKIKGEMVIDGVTQTQQTVLTDDNAHVELNFPVTLPNDERDYNLYALIVYTPKNTGFPLLLYIMNNPNEPFMVAQGNETPPVYDSAESGEKVDVSLYKGFLKGIQGVLTFYIGYSPQEKPVMEELYLNAVPYSLEVE
ncbi:MAG: hypothetical protein HQK77_04375 [Desulfobacterales bacterium]|nr:hypothetical protein [Desulfobacterales bacterium]